MASPTPRHRVPGAVRRQLLLDQVRQTAGSTNIGELAELLSVSAVTIHRDLNALHKEGLINRVHGGATAADPNPDQPATDWAIRIGRMRREKRAIAREARDRIKDGTTIFVDSSTTCLALMKELEKRPPKTLTLVTNSPVVASAIHLPTAHIVVTPGELDQDLRTLEGTWTIDFLKVLHFDLALVSGAAMGAERGLATTQGALAEVIRTAVQTSDASIALIDSSKVNRPALAQVCPVSRFDLVIIDDGVSAADKEDLERAGTEVVVALSMPGDNDLRLEGTRVRSLV